MKEPLSDADNTLIERLKKQGTLLPIRFEQIPSAAFVWSCGDGDRFEQLEFLFRLMRGNDPKKRIIPHLFTWNGGPLVFSSDSPFFGHRFARNQFLKAVALKPHIHAGIVQGHVTCGAACDARLNIIETLQVLRNSFMELQRCVEKNQLTSMTQLICLVHVDYGDRMRTYQFNTTNFTE